MRRVKKKDSIPVTSLPEKDEKFVFVGSFLAFTRNIYSHEQFLPAPSLHSLSPAVLALYIAMQTPPRSHPR